VREEFFFNNHKKLW